MPEDKIDWEKAYRLAKYTRRYPRIHSHEQFQLASAFLKLYQPLRVKLTEKKQAGESHVS